MSLLFSLSMFALLLLQELPQLPAEGAGVCLLLGPAIGFVVAFLKRIPLVKRNPKVVAFVLASLSSVLMPMVGANPVTWKLIVMCVLTQFAGAVTTHEAVIKPVKKAAQGDGSGDTL